MTEVIHHVKVQKMDDLFAYMYPWQFDCTCGMLARGRLWKPVLEAACEHALDGATTPKSDSFALWDEQVSTLDENSLLDPVDIGPAVKARLTWDLFDHEDVPTWLEVVGLTPPNKEGTDKDHADAHRREYMITPLAGLIAMYSTLIADIQTDYWANRYDTEGAPMDDNAKELFKHVSFTMIQAAGMAMLAEMFGEGVIAYGPTTLHALQEQQPG